MTTFVHSKGSRLLLAADDLSQYFQSVDGEQNVETHLVTSYGDNSDNRFVGLGDGALNLSGLFDQTLDGKLAPLIGAAAGSALTFAIGGDTVGDNARVMSVLASKYATSAPIGGMVSVRTGFDPALGGVDGAKVLHSRAAAETVTGQAASVDNSVLTSVGGGAATLHCIAASGTSPTATIKVQHSTNDSTWVDLVTFTALTGVGSQHVEVATGTTINRYLRAEWTIGGTSPSFTFLVAFARRYRS